MILEMALLTLLGVAGGGDTDKRTSAFVPGDFVIGALFPIHYQPPANQRHGSSLSIRCGKTRETYGIQRAEAALQAIDAINQNADLLPNITLGIEIRDECWYAPVALQQSIELVRDSINPIPPTNNSCSVAEDTLPKKKRSPLIGVIGPGASSIALQVQNLLQLFHIPQIGYSATSKDLSDKKRFNYFLRVVPSDYTQAKVIVEILKHRSWTYVSTVNTNENYGQAGIQAFRELAESADICIAREDSILSDAPDAHFDEVILNLNQDNKSQVVVCFCEGFTVKGLIKATKRLNMGKKFLFIGSDGWADRVDVTESVEEEALDSISIRICSPYVQGFDEYYENLKPETNTRNPWFKEFWEDKFNCSFSSTDLEITRQCTGGEKLSSRHRQDAKLRFVIKAVYSLAHALHAMHKNVCGEEADGICDRMLPFNGSNFKDYLMNVSFQYDGETIKFDQNGDPPACYDILNFQKLPNGTYGYIRVANWTNGILSWQTNLIFSRMDNVTSKCAKDCGPGQYKSFPQGGKEKRCCWTCTACFPNSIANMDQTSCMRCANGTAPNENKTSCEKLPIVYVHWNDVEAIVAIVFSSIGLICTIFAFVVFIKYDATPVVRSSTKELCYIILAGMIVSHSSIFAIIAKPTDITCRLTIFVPGLSFAMIYAALLTKTNRIARILTGSKKKILTRKPLFMSAAAQVVITFFLVAIELIICTYVLLVYPPTVSTEDYEEYSVRISTKLRCNISVEAITIPLSFDFVLIILCTVYAVKTRNVPENFNEAKFIGFAMYTTCVIWIAFVPIYFGRREAEVITMSMCVTLSATVPWIFLFLPKLYIILFEPKKNDRAYFKTAKIRCHIGSRVASADSEKSSSASCWEESSKDTHIERMQTLTRTLSCQTDKELLEYLLRPSNDPYGCSAILCGPRITEMECCCDSVDCQMRNITIKFPDSVM